MADIWRFLNQPLPKLADVWPKVQAGIRDAVPAYITLGFIICGFGMMIEGDLPKWFWRLAVLTLVGLAIMGVA